MNPGRRDAVSHVSLVQQEMTAAPVETVQFQYLRVCLCYKFARRYQLRLENPGSFKAPRNIVNIRWESLEHSLLSVVRSGSTMASGNRVCPEQLPLADLS